MHDFIGAFSTFLAERRWVEAVGGPDAGMPACQDWEFYLRLNAVAGVCVVEQPLVLYLLGDDHHRISTRVGAVVAGHRAVYARVRDGLGDLDAGRAVASRRNFMEVFANRGATGDVLRLARDIPLTSYTPELATFTARMAARSVRKRSAQRRASAPAST